MCSLLYRGKGCHWCESSGTRNSGSVHLNAVISKTGDVVDLEVADGPIELVVSAVNAVRQWKYRPYI